MTSVFVSANSALQDRDSERRARLVGGSDTSCSLTVGSSGAMKDMLDLEGAAGNFAVFAPHLQEAGGLPRSSSATSKHRGRGRCSRRSAARITARHKRRNRGATEVFRDNPVPVHATPPESCGLAA
ncbi:MAG: hypothetical protein ACYDEY_10595 [Acidimicrobiales bacterium]